MVGKNITKWFYHFKSIMFCKVSIENIVSGHHFQDYHQDV